MQNQRIALVLDRVCDLEEVVVDVSFESGLPVQWPRVKFASAAGVDLGEMKLFADGRTELSLRGIHGEAQRTLADRVQVLMENWSREFVDQPTKYGLFLVNQLDKCVL